MPIVGIQGCHALLFLTSLLPLASAGTTFSGRVIDPQGKVVGGAEVELRRNGVVVVAAKSDGAGQFCFEKAPAGEYGLIATAAGFVPISRFIRLPKDSGADLRFEEVTAQKQSVTVTPAFMLFQALSMCHILRRRVFSSRTQRIKRKYLIPGSDSSV